MKSGRAAVLAVAVLLLVVRWWRKRRKLPIAGKHVLITGCDTGFGHLSATLLDSKGGVVFAGCYTQEGVQRLRDECSTRMVAFRLDVTKQSSVDHAKQLIVSKLRENGQEERLWGIVNNAGIVGGSLADWSSIECYQRVLDVNFLGGVRVSHAMWPLLCKHSRIVNIISIAGVLALPGAAPYTASKYAMEGYSDVLRREMATWNVHVVKIAPGFCRTNLLSNAPSIIEAAWNQVPEETKLRWGKEAGVRNITAAREQCSGPLLSDPSVVSKTVLQALTVCSPPDRYIVGMDAKLLFRPLSLLPACVQDTVMGLAVKLGGLCTPASQLPFPLPRSSPRVQSSSSSSSFQEIKERDVQ